MQLRSFILAALAAFAVAVPAWAHHSHANYEQSDWLSMEGTVTEVHWMNPHVWLYVSFPDETGQERVWALEGGSVGALVRGGWTRDDVKVGDTISVRCHHLKDKSDGCLLGFVTTANGEPKEFD